MNIGIDHGYYAIKTGWERTMPRFDGVIAVIDANVHGFYLAFVFR